MAVDYQMLFNLLVGIVGILFGWILNTLWSELRKLQAADDKLADKVNNIEVIVAGSYVKRDELAVAMRDLHHKLDRIEERLNEKADR